MEFLQHSGNFLVIWLVNQIAHDILAIIRPLFVKNMALSKPVPNAGDEIDLKIHYLYYNENRVSPISIEFTELMSLGYIGLEAVIQYQIKYISRMPTLRMSYKDKEGDYVDLSQANFSKFLRTVRTSSSDEVPVVNIKVSEGTSPGHFQSSLLVFRNPEKRQLARSWIFSRRHLQLVIREVVHLGMKFSIYLLIDHQSNNR